MFRQLHIEGFRCFKELNVAPLGRVSLFVGKNNSGKTALLDAVETLVDEQPTPFLGGLIRRREVSRRFVEDPKTGLTTVHYLAMVAHLFYGHQISATSRFTISARNQSNRLIQVGIAESPRNLRPKELAIWLQRDDDQRLFLPLTLPDNTLGFPPVAPPRQGEAPVLFIGTELPDFPYLSGLWDKIMLTDDEPLVIEALNLIEPRVERLAFKGEGQDRNIVVKLNNERSPLLLGSLGDGMRHILALALHLVPARKGYLLIDEIDTGLHHSVMGKMWRLVIETAKRLDIQVFATTHSLDCIAALADVQQQLKLTSDDLMMHRLESDLSNTTSYKPEDIAGAIDYQVEVR